MERAVPFLSRLEQLQPGSGKQCLCDYMTDVAKVCLCENLRSQASCFISDLLQIKDDLEPCLAVFLQSTGKVSIFLLTFVF